MIASFATDLAALIVAMATLVTAVGGLLVGRRVHREVRTMNELTIGQLGEATETRRIARVPLADRTAQERRHVEGLPEETQVGTSTEMLESPDVPPAS